MNANNLIAARIKFAIDNGMSPVDALKMVCGSETVDRMIEALYHELRAKAAR
jgi:hypothetical protein